MPSQVTFTCVVCDKKATYTNLNVGCINIGAAEHGTRFKVAFAVNFMEPEAWFCVDCIPIVKEAADKLYELVKRKEIKLGTLLRL